MISITGLKHARNAKSVVRRRKANKLPTSLNRSVKVEETDFIIRTKNVIALLVIKGTGHIFENLSDGSVYGTDQVGKEGRGRQ